MQQPLQFDVDHYKSFFLTYCAWLSQLPLSKHTKRSYRSRVKPFLEFLHGKRLLGLLLVSRDTQEEAVALYIGHLKNMQQHESGSVNNVLTAVDHFYRCLGIAPTRIKRESVRRRVKPITREEQQHLLAVLQERNIVRDTALLLLVMSAGLHLRECAALNLDDICLEPELAIRLVSKSGIVSVIKIENPELVEVLKRLMIEGKGLPPGTPLFLTNKGERLSHAGIDYIVRRIGWTAHLELSVQRLRHTFLRNCGATTEREEAPTVVAGNEPARLVAEQIPYGQCQLVETGSM